MAEGPRELIGGIPYSLLPQVYINSKTIKMGNIPRRTLKTRPDTPHASMLRSMVLQSTVYVTQWTVTDEKKVQLKGKVQK